MKAMCITLSTPLNPYICSLRLISVVLFIYLGRILKTVQMEKENGINIRYFLNGTCVSPCKLLTKIDNCLKIDRIRYKLVCLGSLDNWTFNFENPESVERKFETNFDTINFKVEEFSMKNNAPTIYFNYLAEKSHNFP